MSESRSVFVRFFSWIWRALLGLYRLIIVVSVLLLLFALWTALRGGPSVNVEKNEPLTLIPTGALVDQNDTSSRGFLRELGSERPSQTRVRDLTDALDAARMDARIPFVVIKLDDLQGAGLPQLQEVAAAMKKFRAAGKPEMWSADARTIRFAASGSGGLSELRRGGERPWRGCIADRT